MFTLVLFTLCVSGQAIRVVQYNQGPHHHHHHHHHHYQMENPKDGKPAGLRNHPLSLKYPTGGVSLCDGEIKVAFEQAGMELRGCGVHSDCKGTYSSQIPIESLPYFKDGNVMWTQEHSDALVKAVQKGVDISPPAYPYAVPDFIEALMVASGSKMDSVLVAGSVSPWVEAVLAAHGVSQISTMDYSPREIQTNITKLVLRQDLENASNLYDAIVSYSSIEHDGLGRYCDPINPEGDRAAMQEFHRWLKPDGLLFLGFPVGEKPIIYGNGHRFYDKSRFASITQDFHLIHTCNAHWGKDPWVGSEANQWRNEPWFVLRRKSAER